MFVAIMPNIRDPNKNNDPTIDSQVICDRLLLWGKSSRWRLNMRKDL